MSLVDHARNISVNLLQREWNDWWHLGLGSSGSEADRRLTRGGDLYSGVISYSGNEAADG